LVRQCIAEVIPSGWHLGNSVATQTKEWGLIWRVDFSYDGEIPSAINRFVCWRMSTRHLGSEAAVGQHLKPLSERPGQ
jgi:hypothetical protein